MDNKLKPPRESLLKRFRAFMSARGESHADYRELPDMDETFREDP